MADISPVVRRNAEWAATFVPETFDAAEGTNIAQRYRYQQDQQVYAEAVVDRQEAEMQRLLQTDKGARDLYFRQQNLERQMDRDRFDMDLRAEAHAMKKELFPLEMEAKRATMRATTALERARTNKENRDAALAERTVNDTDGFEAAAFELQAKYPIGSKEFADGLARASMQYAYVPSALRKQWFEQADIDLDPDQMLREAAKLPPEMRGKVTATLNANGKWSMGFAPAAPEKKLKLPGPADLGTETITTEKDGKTTRITRPVAPIPVSASSPTPAIKEVAPAPAPATAAPERIATNPQTGEKVAFRNGQWVPLTP